MIKLLALDIDGTLLDSKGKLPSENKSAIRKAEEKGVLVALCTGRRFRDAYPVALELETNAPIICHNGALIKYADTHDIVFSTILRSQDAIEAIAVGKQFGGDALVSCNPNSKGILLYDRISDSNIPLKNYLEWSRRFHGDEAEQSVHHVDSLEEIIDKEEVIHISFSGSCLSMEVLHKILSNELSNSVNILPTVYPHLDFTLLDILPKDASKGLALAQLANLNSYTNKNVMAIGDNFNDLEMLEYAGIGVLMANSNPDLLTNEQYEKTLSNDQNGVAFAIEKFIL